MREPFVNTVLRAMREDRYATVPLPLGCVGYVVTVARIIVSTTCAEPLLYIRVEIKSKRLPSR